MNKLYNIGIVPVIKINDPSTTLALAKALVDGGIPCVEVTFRTEYAKQAIKDIKHYFPNMCVGAGTILTKEHVDEAIEAGAEFLVSPGLNKTIVTYAKSKGIAFYPGCSSASDIELALELGITNVKFFPSESMGGLDTIKALAGPYEQVRFMPTGGINESNIANYLEFDKVIACGGTFMVPDDLIEAREFDQITALCRRAIKAALGIEIMHVGLNVSDPLSVSQSIQQLTLEPTNAPTSTIFVNPTAEKSNESNTKIQGQMAIGVNDIQRAIRYYEYMGVTLDHDSKVYKDNQLSAIYFKDDIASYRFYLLQK